MVAQDQSEGWLSYWQPEDKPKDIIGDAIILPKGSVQEFSSDAPNMTDAQVHAVVQQPSVEGRRRCAICWPSRARRWANCSAITSGPPGAGAGFHERPHGTDT